MPSSQPSSSTLARATLTGLANLIKLVPTGTMFVFLTLNPILTNNGQCRGGASMMNKYSSTALIALCGLSCVFPTFTDSYADEQGNRHYGVVTPMGLWPNNNNNSLSSYKLRAGDFAHAGLSLLVFGIVALLDRNVVECLYPMFEESAQRDLVIRAAPLVAGVIAGAVLGLFPRTRHGIGYA